MVPHGVAAGYGDRKKWRVLNWLESHEYPSVPFSVDLYGRPGTPAIALQGKLGGETADGNTLVSKSGRGAAALGRLGKNVRDEFVLMHEVVWGSWLA
jgi:hypothetical protein